MTGTSQPAKFRLSVEGINCACCATKIENALQRMPGVSAASVSGGPVTVNHDAGSVGEDNIRNQIADIGYRVTWPALALGDTHGDARGESRSHRERPSHVEEHASTDGDRISKSRRPPNGGPSLLRCWSTSLRSDDARSPLRGPARPSRSKCRCRSRRWEP